MIIKGVYLIKLQMYLKDNHPSMWKEMTPKRLLWISRDDFPIGNYFKQMKFVLFSDKLGDTEVASLKRKIRIYFFLFWLLVFYNILIF